MLHQLFRVQCHVFTLFHMHASYFHTLLLQWAVVGLRCATYPDKLRHTTVEMSIYCCMVNAFNNFHLYHHFLQVKLAPTVTCHF